MDRSGYGGGGGAGQYNHFAVPPPNYQQIPNKTGNYNEPPPNYSKLGGGYDSSHRGAVGGVGGGGSWNDRGTNSYGNGGASKDNYNKGYGSSSGNGGTVGGSGNGNDMITQEDTIFVSGMDPSTTEQDIETHFGAIGIIKKDKRTMKPKIWLYKNKDTGTSKGEATVTYDDVNAAQSAIQWFDGNDFNGSNIKVSLAQRQNNWNKGGGGGGGSRGGFGGRNRSGGGAGRFDRGGGSDYERGSSGGSSNRGGGRFSGSCAAVTGGNVQPRDGDWKCSSCNNTNFAWRNECNRCKTPKGDDDVNSGSSSFGGGGGCGFGGINDRANDRGSGGGYQNRDRGNGGGGGYSRYFNDNGGGGGRGRGGGGRRDGGGAMRNDGGMRSRPY